MNTLNRDRNTLKRLVESYGKKDVLNFVKHLNEEVSIEDSPAQKYLRRFFNIDNIELAERETVFSGTTRNFDTRYACLPNTPNLLKAAINPVVVGKYWIVFTIEDFEKTLANIGFDDGYYYELGEVIDPTLGCMYEDAVNYLREIGCNI